MHRFYIPPEAWHPDRLELDAEETKHATQVMRLKAGDRAVVFNGRGDEATVELAEKTGTTLPVKAQQFGRSQPVACRITLGQAIPKGKTMDLIVQKATELGAATIAPILSERTIVQLAPDEAESKRDKWERTALEACKQCGRNFLPEIAKPRSMRQFLEATRGEFDLALIASLQPDAQPLDAHLRFHEETQGGERPKRLLILIGPEGDFTPAEIGEARSAGAFPLTLGPIVLRSETAALYTLSVLGYELF